MCLLVKLFKIMASVDYNVFLVAWVSNVHIAYFVNLYTCICIYG